MQVVIAVLGLVGQVALMPAHTKLSAVGTGTDAQARSIAHSDLVLTRHTCTVPEGATAANVCPDLFFGRKAVPKMEWQLQVPAGARWLFFGPSYMAEIFGAVVAANKDQIVQIENHPEFARELNANEKDMPPCNGTVLPCCIPVTDLTCNVMGSERQCRTQADGMNVITLTNGAVLVGVNNHMALQEESAAQRIADAFYSLSLDHMFYMHPHNWESDGMGGTYKGPAGLCFQDEPPSNPARRLGSEDGHPAPAGHLSEDMCIGGYGNESLPGAAYIDCVESSALWPVLRWVARSATLVAPTLVAAGKATFGGKDTQVPVYYTQPQSDRAACSTYDNYAEPGGQVSWEYYRAHQCTVLYDPGSDTYLGGSVLDMAEDLLGSVAK